MKRGIQAQLTTLHVLYNLCAEAFFGENQELFKQFTAGVRLNKTFKRVTPNDIKKAHEDLLTNIRSTEIPAKVICSRWAISC